MFTNPYHVHDVSPFPPFAPTPTTTGIPDAALELHYTYFLSRTSYYTPQITETRTDLRLERRSPPSIKSGFGIQAASAIDGPS